MKEKILVTGTAGFIGANFTEFVMPKYFNHYNFVSIDKLVDKYNINYIPKNHKFYLGDITDAHFINRVFEIERPDYILHFAAESFVDSSIENPSKFSHSNVYGTQILVEAAIKYNIQKFLYVSTDEVYGQLTSINDKPWDENQIPHPRNNYSASKYGGELLIFSANQVHGLQYNITRCCNNIGKFQPFRNLFPKIVINILTDNIIYLHDQGKPIREWISPIDHSNAIMNVLLHGNNNEIYNIGTDEHCTNLELVNLVSKYLDKKPKISFEFNRPGQDFRYAINSSKIRKLGWKPEIHLDKNIKESIEWYKENINLFI